MINHPRLMFFNRCWKVWKPSIRGFHAFSLAPQMLLSLHQADGLYWEVQSAVTTFLISCNVARTAASRQAAPSPGPLAAAHEACLSAWPCALHSLHLLCFERHPLLHRLAVDALCTLVRHGDEEMAHKQVQALQEALTSVSRAAALDPAALAGGSAIAEQLAAALQAILAVSARKMPVF